MKILFVLGIVLSLLGVVGLLWCVHLVIKARKTAQSDEELRQKLQKATFLNMGALALSALGLMLVVFGGVLG